MLVQAIVLGIVQGLTEFVPVSSSGHLIAVRHLLGWNDVRLDQTFDVALHIGTMTALVAYYRRDWRTIIVGWLRHVVSRVPYHKDEVSRPSGRMLVPIVVASIPTAIAGYFWEHVVEHKLGAWYLIAAALVVVGLVMLVADRIGSKKRGIEQMDYLDFVSIGCAQAFALFPGVSRSGITLSAGLFRGLDRSSAARFSFLLSTPIILAAGLGELHDLSSSGVQPTEITPILIGFAAAAGSGYLAIHFLISYLRKRSLGIFVAYRIVFAGVLAAEFLTR